MKPNITKNLIPNPLRTKISKFPFIENKNESAHPKYFLIRHAESKFNLAIRNLEKSKDSKNLKSYLEEKEKIRFGHEYLDSELTNTGLTQCQNAGINLVEGKVEVKYVFVSPLKRCLLTCQKTLEAYHSGNQSVRKPEIVVHPMLFEKVEDSCDLIKDIQENMKNFPMYNWEMFRDIDHPSVYQLKFLDTHHMLHKYDYYQQAIDNFLKNKNYDHHEFVLDAMTHLGREDKFIESSKTTFERLANFKSFLSGSHLDKGVLIFGHSVLFKHVTAESVSENEFEPSHDTEVLKNCGIAGLSFH
jgi:broad specificity phosphatase PhoE